jgi:hypothetical protein
MHRLGDSTQSSICVREPESCMVSDWIGKRRTCEVACLKHGSRLTSTFAADKSKSLIKNEA